MLFDVVEERWRERFGRTDIDRLRELLGALDRQIDADLPDCLPILGYGLFSDPTRVGRDAQRATRTDHHMPGPPSRDDINSRLPLSTLLSRVLLAFAVEFERESKLSLAVGANVLGVLDGQAVRVRDLPGRVGVSRPAIDMTLGVLQKAGAVVVETVPTGGPTKIVRLSPKGRRAQEVYGRVVSDVEGRWRERFGDDAVGQVRAALERLVGEPGADLSPLLEGLRPYPEGWRAAVAPRTALPHYPMVLHRGGYPDGG